MNRAFTYLGKPFTYNFHLHPGVSGLNHFHSKTFQLVSKASSLLRLLFEVLDEVTEFNAAFHKNVITGIQA